MRDAPDRESKPWLVNLETRRQLRRLCDSARTRTVNWKLPNRWMPGSVRDPITGEYFDTSSAWDYICWLFDAGVEVEQIDLDNPPGKKGYVLFGEAGDGQRVYIKLMFLGRLVAGRSFHISDEKSREK